MSLISNLLAVRFKIAQSNQEGSFFVVITNDRHPECLPYGMNYKPGRWGFSDLC